MRDLHFIIDGYNATKTDPATVALDGPEQRGALVRRLAVRAEALLGPGRVTVVFDGHSDGYAEQAGAIEVRFSGDVSADEVIVALAGPGTVVITDDRALRSRVEAAGAKVRPSATVFEAASGVPTAKRRGRMRRDVGLPPGANRITAELKELWLEDEEG